jgi:hypothetical protein
MSEAVSPTSAKLSEPILDSIEAELKTDKKITKMTANRLI